MTAPSIPALLEPIQARLDAATPGPWSATQAADEESTTWIEATNGDVLHHDERGYGHMRESFAWMKRADADFIANAPTDTARLLAAVKAVAEMHKPVRIYENDEYGHAQTEDESKYVRSICEVCSDSSVTENLDDGNYDLAGEYGEVGWPCPTVSAVEAALRDEA